MQTVEIEDNTACSNCKCPINFECARFQLFNQSKYILLEEFQHNGDYTCEYKIDEHTEQTSSQNSSSLF